MNRILNEGWCIRVINFYSEGTYIGQRFYRTCSTNCEHCSSSSSSSPAFVPLIYGVRISMNVGATVSDQMLDQGET